MRPFDPALLRALPATRGPVAVLSAVGIASGVVAIAQAVVLALTATRIVTGGPLTEVLTWLAVLLIARGVLAGLTELVARWAGLRVVGIVRLAVLRRWLRRPEGGRPATDVALARAGEGVSALEPYVARYLPALVTAAVVPTLAVLTLLWVDPWSALIVVLTLPLLPVFAALIGMHTQEETQARWGAMALLAGHFLDVVRGLPTLVGYGRARAQVGVVRDVGERHRRATVRTLRTAFLSTAALELLATISVAMVAVAVGLRLAHGHLDLLVGLTAILLAPEAYWPVRRVGQEFHAAADGAAVLEDLAAEGALTPRGATGETVSTEDLPAATARASAPAAPPAIALTEVTYAHPGRERTVVNLGLDAPAGPGLVALVGPSGAGKTTALELLAGLRVPDSGRVSAPRAHLATQRPVILPGTVRDNLQLAGGAEDAALVAALGQVGLWAQLEAREGLDTVLGDDGFGLSAGQRARLALARAVISDAPLVLLDEPTANVAADSIPLLHQVVLDLARERRVVAVTHGPALTELADRVWRIAPPPARSRPASSNHTVRSVGVQSNHSVRSVGVQSNHSVRSVGVQSNHTVRSVGVQGNHSVRSVGERGDSGESLPPGEPLPPGQVRPLPLPQGRGGLVAACLLGGASVACGVALTATSGWLIVQASTMPVVLTLLVAIVGVRAFGLFRPVFRYAERVVSHDVALADLADRRADVFARLIPLTPARLGRRSRGEMLTAVVRDLDDVVDAQVRVTVPAWSAVIATVVGSAIAAWHLPLAGAAVAAGGALVLGLALLGRAAERRAQDRAVTARGEIQHRTTALVSRLLPLQSVAGLDADPARLLAPIEAAERRQRGAEQRLITARALVLAACWVVVAATVAVVAVLTWQAHDAGHLSGPYAALVALVPMALADTWVGTADVAGAHARAAAAAARLERVLGQTPAVADRGTGSPPVAPPHLRLTAVGASWTGTARQLQSSGTATDPTPTTSDLDLSPVDLDLPPGSRVALTGANGAGKSTALAVLARHLDPATGRYAVSGQDVLGLDLERTRGRIAVVEDEPHAFAGSVRANLALAAPDPDEVDDEALVAALEAVDLGHWFGTLPDGLDTPLTGLSGGERARLSLARAVVSRRPVVLLDEPTAHLDDATAGRALDGLHRSRTPGEGVLVVVSHREDTVLPWTDAQVRLTGAGATDHPPGAHGSGRTALRAPRPVIG